ncbi:hypothetical protein ACJIZ3_008837 [Penstemon smallii]|uniref:Uncharacterized protein n=1 Tax=Penstemon smallii TaxID=265156 RepID=A0ABD3TBX2_9LAMI
MREKVYEEKFNTMRGDIDNMMLQWQMMMARVADTQPSYYMSSPMFGYMGNMAPLPHQLTQTPPQAQSSPHVQSSPHAQSQPQDVIRPFS